MNKKSKIALAIISATLTGHAAWAGESMHGGSGPSVSVALEGRYASQDSDSASLHGFQVGGHAPVYSDGFSTGHNAITISSKISKNTSGTLDFALESHDGETSIAVEEAYFETSALGNGISVKAGQFFSGIGNQNAVHGHHQDFANASLVYVGMFGGHLSDTGVQFKWAQKGGLNAQVGAELTTGTSFPGGGADHDETTEGNNEDNNAGFALFAKAGGSIGSTSSWKAGLSLYSSEFGERSSSAGHHGDSSLGIHGGETDVTGLDVEYLFSPKGKGKVGEIKISLEHFSRSENGEAEFSNGTGDVADATASADYDGEQSGYYLSAVYRFMPKWRAGVRLDHLESDNTFSNFANPDNVLEEAGGVAIADDHDFAHATGLGSDEDPERTTLMVDYSPNGSSVIRAQYMIDDTGAESENRLYLQYVVTLGGHGH